MTPCDKQKIIIFGLTEYKICDNNNCGNNCESLTNQIVLDGKEVKYICEFD